MELTLKYSTPVFLCKSCTEMYSGGFLWCSRRWSLVSSSMYHAWTILYNIRYIGRYLQNLLNKKRTKQSFNTTHQVNKNKLHIFWLMTWSWCWIVWRDIDWHSFFFSFWHWHFWNAAIFRHVSEAVFVVVKFNLYYVSFLSIIDGAKICKLHRNIMLIEWVSNPIFFF